MQIVNDEINKLIDKKMKIMRDFKIVKNGNDMYIRNHFVEAILDEEILSDQYGLEFTTTHADFVIERVAHQLIKNKINPDI